MEPKYTAQFTIEDLIPESAVETTDTHLRCLNEAAHAVMDYLTVHATETGRTPGKFPYHAAYLSANGVVVHLNVRSCERNREPPFGLYVEGATILFVSNTAPLDPLKKKLKDIIHKVYEASQPHPEIA